MTSQGPRIVEGPQPKHQQLRELLIGMVVPGQAIPSERDLMATHGVSRATVRKAIDGLVSDGLLQRTHGLGTFAVRPRLETNLHLASFSQDMRRRGLAPSTQVVSLSLETPPTEAADWLGLDAGEQAWHLIRIRLADHSPIAHEDAWYPASLLPDLDQQDLINGSLYEILGQHYDLWIDHAQQTVWSETARTDLARQLSAPLHAPLMVFRRRSSASGLPVEYVVSRYRGDRYQVHMDLRRDDPPPK